MALKRVLWAYSKGTKPWRATGTRAGYFQRVLQSVRNKSTLVLNKSPMRVRASASLSAACHSSLQHRPPLHGEAIPQPAGQRRIAPRTAGRALVTAVRRALVGRVYATCTVTATMPWQRPWNRAICSYVRADIDTYIDA